MDNLSHVPSCLNPLWLELLSTEEAVTMEKAEYICY